MPGTNSSPTNAESTRVPDDVVADLLSIERVRYLLETLADRDESMAVEDLARAIAAREADVDSDTVDAETVRAVRDDVFQRLLPKLTPTGIVSYDSMLGTVALDTADERVRSEVE